MRLGPGDLQNAMATVRAHLGSSPLEEVQVDGQTALLKLELFLPTRSFKVRGALVAVARYGDSGRGLVTASTGNFGMALAFAGSALGAGIHVFAPAATPSAKLSRIANLGAELHVGGSLDDATVRARMYSENERMRFVSPYNDLSMILGAMTIYQELIAQLEGFAPSRIYCPVGGGGLLAGVGSAARLGRHEVQCISAFPDSSTALFNAVHGSHLPNGEASIADGLVGGIDRQSMTIEMARTVTDLWIAVTEQEIRQAMFLLLTDARVIAEGAGATGLAALRKQHLVDTGRGSPSVVLISGGNISYSAFREAVDGVGDPHDVVDPK